MTFKFIEIFAGIGGMSFGLEQVGGECVMASEYDPFTKTQFTQMSYKLLHPDTDVRGDVSRIGETSVPDHDIMAFTPPCQSFSVAGKRAGFEDTRGTLTFEALRIAKYKRPKVLFMENVKGLVNHDKGRTLDTVIQAIDDLGYTVDFNVLNSKYFGVPQSRERVFLIAIRNDLVIAEPWLIEGNTVVAKGKKRISRYNVKTFNFGWPSQDAVSNCLRDVLEPVVDEKYYYKDGVSSELIAHLELSMYLCDKPSKPHMLGHINLKGHDAIKRVYGIGAVGPTLTTMQGGHREPKVAIWENGRCRIRKLTPLECFRLQGFSDLAHQTLVDAGISDSQRYKQAGNAVTVNVIEAIGRRMIPLLDTEKRP